MEKPYNVIIKKYYNSHQIKAFKNHIKPNSSSNNQVKNLTKKTREKNGNRFSEDENLEKIDYEELAQNKIRSMKNSINRSKDKIYGLAQSNVWLHFLTFTLDPKKIDRYDYNLTTKTIRKFFNNIKNRYDETLRYLLIPEAHKDGAVHFHALVGSDNPKDLEIALQLEFSGNYDKGNKVYNINRFNLGYTTSTRVLDTQKVSTYVTKYITKELMLATKNKQRYFRSNNLREPEIIRLHLEPEELQKFILEQEKKAINTENSYTKTINIQAPGYDNQLDIYNFPTSYEEQIADKLLNYFDSYNLSIN